MIKYEYDVVIAGDNKVMVQYSTRSEARKMKRELAEAGLKSVIAQRKYQLIEESVVR